MTTNTGITHGMCGNYNANSFHQLDLTNLSIPYICEAVDVLEVEPSCNPLIIADFGSSHGLNSMHIMKTIIRYLRETKKIENEREILVVHNDLPTNDWASFFDVLNKDNSYHGVANGRSFYEPCLPTNSLAIGYSSASLHWLSRKPCNLSNHCIGHLARDKEYEPFKDQAKLDLTAFLQHRSRELKTGGILILTITSADNQGSTGFDCYDQVLCKCAQTLLSPQELLDFTIPLYNRSFSECVDNEIFAQCSLKLIKAEFSEMRSRLFDEYLSGHMTLSEFAKKLTPIIRTWCESPLKQALSNSDRSKENVDCILMQFWMLLEEQIKEQVNANEFGLCFYITYLILKKV